MGQEEEEELRALPDRPPRQCPACGARVAEGAKTCLMCGAALDEEAVVAEIAPTRQLTRKQLLILSGVAVVILVASVITGLTLSRGGVLPTPTPTVTFTPTITLTPTVTPTPTETPVPLPTSTPIPPQSYTVQSGDTLSTIAEQFDLTADELVAYNAGLSEMIVEGDAILIPPPTPTVGPTPTLDPSQPTPTYAPFIIHTVQSGETLSTIAEKYGVRVADIQAASNIEAGTTMIQVGEVLQIPHYTPTPTLPAEMNVAGTPTPQAVYAPPALLYPSNGMVFTGTKALIVLQWAATGILEEQEYYRVEFTAPTAGGTPVTTYAYVRATSWRVPEENFPPTEVKERTCTWKIDIVRRTGSVAEPGYTVIGKSEGERSFTWNAAQP